MVARLVSVIVVMILFSVICADRALCIGPQDTLRTDTGEIIPTPDPGECGVDYADSQLIASFNPDYFNLPSGQSEAPLDSCLVESALMAILDSHYVDYVSQVFTGAEQDDTTRVVRQDTVMVPDLSHIFVLRQDASCDVLDAVEDLYSHDATRFAEPNYYGELLDEPDDPYWDDSWLPQWNLQDTGYGIECPTAWGLGYYGDYTVRLGIIDTGINYRHNDFIPNGDPYPNLKIAGGYDYGENDPDPLDRDGHGTHVAGIAGALTNNGTGIAGISGGWHRFGGDTGVKIYALKHTPGGVEAKARAMFEGTDPEGRYGCHIINCSWLAGNFDAIMPAIYAAYKVGANVVGGKPNSPTSNIWYPIECPYRNWVIGVAGYGTDGKFCDGDLYCGYYSDKGFGIDIVAPGWRIPSTDIVGGISAFEGNSAATPHVSGAVALLRSIDNSLKPEDYEGILNYSADDPSSPEGDGDVWTWDERYGHGRLKVSTAVTRMADTENWPLERYTATGGQYTTVTKTTYRFLPPTEGDEYLDGQFDVDRVEVRVNVTYPEEYRGTPYVWGLGEGPEGQRTIGWSAADPNYQAAWCQLVPDLQQPDGCTLRTYVFKVYDPDPEHQWAWYPCAPEDVELQYSLWGQLSSPFPKPNGGSAPAAISLRGIYPNPFNVSTVLSYQLEESAELSISVYNIIGQKVATLFQGNQLAGQYELTWDASRFPSGVYFARLRAGKRVVDAKMLLLK